MLGACLVNKNLSRHCFSLLTVYGGTSGLVIGFQQEENQVTPKQIFSKMGCMSLCPSTIPLLTFTRDKTLGHGAHSLPTAIPGPQGSTTVCDLLLSREQPVSQTVPHTGGSRHNPCGLGVEGISPGFRADLRSVVHSPQRRNRIPPVC